MSSLYQTPLHSREKDLTIKNNQLNHLQIEKIFTEKITVARNIFHRIKDFTSELEVLVMGIIKIYCSNNFSEKKRVELLLNNIQNEIKDFEKRVQPPSIPFEKQVSPKENKLTVPTFNDSMASTYNGNNTMMAIRNDVKGLINEYKEAVNKLKAENAVIHSLVAEKNSLSPQEKIPTSHHDRRRFQNSPMRNREKDVDDYEISRLKGDESTGVAKYAELNHYIDELNQKKEENLHRLATVENRLNTIRRSIPDQDTGMLKTSDLIKDEGKPVLHPSSRKREILREHNYNLPSPQRVRKGRDPNSKYSEYVKKIDRKGGSRSVKKRSERENYYEGEKDYSYEGKSRNESRILEEEIGDLNKEIEVIKNLLDSALLQRKYQSK